METTTTTPESIHDLAIRAAAGTLKRIYDGGTPRDTSRPNNSGGNDTIRKLRQSLQADLAHLRNVDYAADDGIQDRYTMSDAYDLVTVAYSYLYQRIMVEGMDAQDEETRTLKSGATKTRTVYQWACVEVRKAIYAEKSIENNGKYTYIEDLRRDGETAENALDRHYIRLGKYYDLGGAIGSGDITSGMDGIYTADNDTADGMRAMLDALNLTPRQRLIIHYRLQGLDNAPDSKDAQGEPLTVSAIAQRLGVSQQAVSKTLAQVQAKIMAQYPQAVRAFRDGRN